MADIFTQHFQMHFFDTNILHSDQNDINPSQVGTELSWFN